MEQGRARESFAPRPHDRVPDEHTRAPERASRAYGPDPYEPQPYERSTGEAPDGPYQVAHTGERRSHAAGTGAGSHVPEQVRRHSVRGQILHALRIALANGALEPGEVYSAPALAERFGVSPTPVREAMQQLAAEGSVEVVPNRGYRVAERGPDELAELAEVRALIEVPVMLRLARTVPAERWAELRPLAELASAAAERGDPGSYIEHDRAFHRALLSLAGNKQLVTVADELHRRAQWPPAGSGGARRADLVADAAGHIALLEALGARDLRTVAALVRDHFTGASR